MSGQLHAPVALFSEKAPGTYRIEGWVDPSACLDNVEKRNFTIGIL
jgi:hypothetical protein